MSKKKLTQALSFIEYISKPIDLQLMFNLYTINSITPERMELYYDFIYSLCDLIVSTHMGDEIMTDEDNEKHFKWCWDKTITSFEKEHIYFGDIDSELFTYFFDMINEEYYLTNKDKMTVDNIFRYWETCFKYDTIKTMSELENMIDIYKLFGKTIYSKVF